jgi:hypothetical protein
VNSSSRRGVGRLGVCARSASAISALASKIYALARKPSQDRGDNVKSSGRH